MSKVKTISINGKDLDIATNWENVDNKPDSVGYVDLARISVIKQKNTDSEEVAKISFKTVDGKQTAATYDAAAIDSGFKSLEAKIPTFEYDESSETLTIKS
jgi:hypothetical protein